METREEESQPQVVRLPSWLIGLVVSLLVTAAGSLAALAYNAGGLVEGVRSIGHAMERFEVRMQHLEEQQHLQGEDLARCCLRSECGPG